MFLHPINVGVSPGNVPAAGTQVILHTTTSDGALSVVNTKDTTVIVFNDSGSSHKTHIFRVGDVQNSFTEITASQGVQQSSLDAVYDKESDTVIVGRCRFNAGLFSSTEIQAVDVPATGTITASSDTVIVSTASGTQEEYPLIFIDRKQGYTRLGVFSPIDTSGGSPNNNFLCQLFATPTKTSVTFDEFDPSRTLGIVQTAGVAGETKNVAILAETSAIHSGEVAGSIGYASNTGVVTTFENDFPIGRFISSTNLRVTKNP